MDKVEEFLNTLGTGGAGLAKGEIFSFYKWAVDEGDDFIKRQKTKIDKYLLQLAAQEINKEEFEDCVKDIKNLTEMQILKMSVAQKAAAQRLLNGIQDLLIDNLLKIL